jgi:predicted secreted protein
MAGKFGFGTTLSATLNGSLTPIAELTSITGVEMSADEIDVTSHDSPNGYREFLQGLRNGGSVTIEGNFIADASQEGLADLFDSGATVAMEIEFAGNVATWAFDGFVSALSTDAPMDNKISFSATIKISGKPVLSVGS